MIADDIRSATPELRAQAESMMTMVGTINEPGTGHFDVALDQWIPGAGEVIYSGALRLRAENDRAGTTQLVGEQQITVQRYAGFAPWQTAGIHPDCTVTVTVSSDPHLVGRTLTIITVEAHEPAIHRKFTALDNLG